MTSKEINNQIKREERRIRFLKESIVETQWEIKATRETVAFWKKELKKAKKEGR